MPFMSHLINYNFNPCSNTNSGFHKLSFHIFILNKNSQKYYNGTWCTYAPLQSHVLYTLSGRGVTLTPTTITIQMADRSLAQPEGVLEDVLVKVGKFIFHGDFVVMKIEEANQVPLLLGRPFLATGAALIDVQKGELTLRVGDEAVHFNLNKILTQSDVDAENCNAVDNNNPIRFDLISDCNLQHSNNEKEMNFQYLESVDYELLHSSLPNIETVLSLNENSQENSCSHEKEATKQETSVQGLILKELPSHLKYAFLEPEKGKPIIISTKLIENEEQRQLQILRKHKEAIAWSIEDLKGISPSICMQKILLNDDAKTSKEAKSYDKRCCRKGSIEMVECRLYLCNIRQLLGEPSSCGSQEGWIYCDQK